VVVWLEDIENGVDRVAEHYRGRTSTRKVDETVDSWAARKSAEGTRDVGVLDSASRICYETPEMHFQALEVAVNSPCESPQARR